MSLRLRLLLALVPLFILGLVVANVGTYKALQSSLLSRVDDQLVSSHRTVEDALVRGFGGGPGGASTAPGTYGELRNPAGSAVLRQAFQRDFGGALDTSTHPVLPSTMPPGTHYFLSVLLTAIRERSGK